jgi:hypothetical protein
MYKGFVKYIRRFLKESFSNCDEGYGITSTCTDNKGGAYYIKSLDGGADVYLWATGGTLQSGDKAALDAAIAANKS